MNVDRAKKIVKELTIFIDTAEKYTTKDVKGLVVKYYAFTGSIKKVTERINNLGYEIKSSEVSEIIKSNPKDDELHKIVKKFYKDKLKKMSQK
ncbi:hypothetical protein B4102_3312 [Heyndrickxia sporothermodurans]|uniref:Uncharacterized protein n=1 Tax=Heyndrickxia sporothermodurans TaxID=46224 RepID=A0A150KVR7_9BACI|nr:hypothetical protein [Heyndrickxia sporothermodurans]KYD04163.1 hypothetical protein B4102_3312 [Heyndrickxia sporothermodurans]